MPSLIDQQLRNLNEQLIQMGELCETAIENAVTALVEDSSEHAKRAIALDEKIDEKEREIEALCLTFMMRNQPVARDLRQVSSALKMITDMERIGDQARDIAEITNHISIRDTKEIQLLREMATATQSMVHNSIKAYVTSDLELARQVVQDDDIVDNYFVIVKNQLVTMIHRDGELAEHGLDLLMIAKYFERIGDHATNIGEWVEFSITGIHVNE